MGPITSIQGLNMSFRKKALTAAAVTTLSFSAFAAENGPQGYIGFSIGQATVEDFCDDSPDGFSCEDSALSGRLHAGSHLNDFVDLEIGYRYIDDVGISASINGISAKVDINVHTLDTTLQFGFPAEGPFRIFSKAGLLLWKLNLEASATNGSLSASESDDDSGVALRTGLGVSYDLSDKVTIRGDWDYLVDVGDEDETGEADIHVFSVGPQFRF